MRQTADFTPVFLFAHDYGTHLPYCEILQVETGTCSCGFKDAFEAALASERGARRDRSLESSESLQYLPAPPKGWYPSGGSKA